MELRANHNFNKQHICSVFYGFLIVVLVSSSCYAQEEFDDDGLLLSNMTYASTNCTECGCTSLYIYDEATHRCLVNFSILERILVYYDKQDVDFEPDDIMAESIHLEGQRIFKGIMISVLLFITCTCFCIIVACIYCCRINYTDRVLKNDIKALAKKLKRTYNSKNYSKKNPPLPPLSESCTVVCEDVGIVVV